MGQCLREGGITYPSINVHCSFVLNGGIFFIVRELRRGACHGRERWVHFWMCWVKKHLGLTSWRCSVGLGYVWVWAQETELYWVQGQNTLPQNPLLEWDEAVSLIFILKEPMYWFQLKWIGNRLEHWVSWAMRNSKIFPKNQKAEWTKKPWLRFTLIPYLCIFGYNLIIKFPSVNTDPGFVCLFVFEKFWR